MRKILLSSLVCVALCCTFLCLLFAAEESQAAAAAQTQSSSSSSSGSSKSAQARQSAASMIGTIGSLVPGLITNVAPLVILFGLGALMMPALGMGALGLLRESRRSSNVGNEQPAMMGNVGLPAAFAQYARPLQSSPQDIYYFTKRSFPSIMSGLNSASVLHAAQEILERVARAIDNADKRYN